jgi:hypothetical protein
MDHCVLQCIFTQSDLNERQRIYSKLLSEYDFSLTYIKGTLNRVNDVLIQRPCIFLVIHLQMNLREIFLTIQRDDYYYQEVKEFIRQNTMLIPKFEVITMENDGLKGYNNQIYVPPNDELRSLILNKAHREVYMSHPIVTKMREYLKPLFFWKEMKEDIVNYTTICLDCQQVKAEKGQNNYYNHTLFQNQNGRSFQWISLLYFH